MFPQPNLTKYMYIFNEKKEKKKKYKKRLPILNLKRYFLTKENVAQNDLSNILLHYNILIFEVTLSCVTLNVLFL